MPKYVEIKGSDGQPAGHVLDYENGYKEVYDKSGQPSAYVYDQEAMNNSLLQTIEKEDDKKSTRGGGFPTIEENGLTCCIIVHVAHWSRLIIPFIFILCGFRFLSAIISFCGLSALQFLYNDIAYSYYNKQNYEPIDRKKKRSKIGLAIFLTYILLGSLFTLPF